MKQLLGILFFVLSACTSKLIVLSEPPGADVFVGIPGKKDPKKIGVTPVEVSEIQLSEHLQLTSSRADFIEIQLQKKDYQTEKALLPSNRWGELSKTIKFHLEPGTDEAKQVRGLIRHLLNAQKFAQTRQYEQAHTELDKALATVPNFAQAMSVKGAVYFLQGNMSEAEKWYRKAVDIDPDMEDSIKMLEKIKAASSSKGSGS